MKAAPIRFPRPLLLRSDSLPAVTLFAVPSSAMPLAAPLRPLLLARFLLLVGFVPAPLWAQAPQAPTATAGNQEVVLRWTAPSTDADESILCYRVYRDTAPIPEGDPEDTSAPRVATVPADEDTAYRDEGLTNGTTYHYRLATETLEEEDAPAECGDAGADVSALSAAVSATPALRPSLEIEAPSVPVGGPVTAGEAVVVRAEASGLVSDASVQLQYRRGGADAFTIIPMTGNEDEYVATIPGTAVGARGVEFQVVTEDEQGATVTAPTTGVASVRVTVEDLSTTQTGGTTQTAYRLFSMPTALERPGLTEVFAALRPYEPRRWRLFGLADTPDASDAPYVERAALDGALFPGAALWLITRSGASIGPMSGTSLRTDRPSEVPLQDGWNLVGNPFAFPIARSQLRAEDGSLQDVFAYDGAFRAVRAGDVLPPYGGVLVRLAGGAAGTLRIDPSAAPEASTAASSSVRTEAGWRLRLRARSGRAQDVENVVGTVPGARASVERHDGHEPPPIGDYVSLAFDAPGTEARLWRDMRAPGRPVYTWTTTVRTSQAGRVTLSAALESVPPDRAVWLVDPALSLSHNLREEPRYRFWASGEGAVRSLTLVVGAPDAVARVLDRPVPTRLRLLPPVPNPVEQQVSLRVEVPSETRITLEVFDLLGRRVATLAEGRAVAPGRHALSWRPSADGLASGPYVVRLRSETTVRTRRVVVSH